MALYSTSFVTNDTVNIDFYMYFDSTLHPVHNHPRDPTESDRTIKIPTGGTR